MKLKLIKIRVQVEFGSDKFEQKIDV